MPCLVISRDRVTFPGTIVRCVPLTQVNLMLVNVRWNCVSSFVILPDG